MSNVTLHEQYHSKLSVTVLVIHVFSVLQEVHNLFQKELST